jgi:hypothetical protein
MKNLVSAFRFPDMMVILCSTIKSMKVDPVKLKFMQLTQRVREAIQK